MLAGRLFTHSILKRNRVFYSRLMQASKRLALNEIVIEQMN